MQGREEKGRRMWEKGRKGSRSNSWTCSQFPPGKDNNLPIFSLTFCQSNGTQLQ